MILPHKTEICVADGRKFLLLVNVGDTVHPDLQVIREVAQDNPKTTEQGSDRPGRMFESDNVRSSAYDETDFHQVSEDRFAAEMTDVLNRRAMEKRFEKLVIIAPPATLGEMRRHYHKNVLDRLVAEIGKEATNLPSDEIVRMIDAA